MYYIADMHTYTVTLLMKHFPKIKDAKVLPSFTAG